MTSAPAREAAPIAVDRIDRVYAVLGVRIGVASEDPGAIDLIDRSFGALHRPADPPGTIVSLRVANGVGLVSGPEGTDVPHPTLPHARLALLSQVVIAIMAGLRAGGRYAVHAAAAVRDGRAVIISGPGGTGKTTLGLALAARGWELLSDEIAVLDPIEGSVLPYRRNVHVRPGTPELVPGLEHLLERPREMLGGGIAWAVHPSDLGSGMDEHPRPLAGVVMLRQRSGDGIAPSVAPLRTSLCVTELLRATWASSVDFRGALHAIGRSLDGVPCAALVPGTPTASAAAVEAWFEEMRG